MNPSQVANRVMWKHRDAMKSPTMRTLANMLVEAAEAGYAAALTNMRIAEAQAGAAIEAARARSR